MVKTFVKVVLGGAIGCGALFAVGKICFEVGREMGQTECRYEAMKKAIERTEKLEPEDMIDDEVEEEVILNNDPEVKKVSKLKLAMGLFKAGRKKGGVKDLIKDHEIQLNATIKPKN